MSFAIGVSLLVELHADADDDRPPREAARRWTKAASRWTAKQPILARLIDLATSRSSASTWRVLGWVMVAPLDRRRSRDAHRSARAFRSPARPRRASLPARATRPASSSRLASPRARASRRPRSSPSVWRGSARARRSREDRRDDRQRLRSQGERSRSIYVGLVDPEKRKASQEELMERARREIAASSRPRSSVRVFGGRPLRR